MIFFQRDQNFCWLKNIFGAKIYFCQPMQSIFEYKRFCIKSKSIKICSNSMLSLVPSCQVSFVEEKTFKDLFKCFLWDSEAFISEIGYFKKSYKKAVTYWRAKTTLIVFFQKEAEQLFEKYDKNMFQTIFTVDIFNVNCWTILSFLAEQRGILSKLFFLVYLDAM